MGAGSRKNVQLAMTELPRSCLIEAVLTVGVFSFASMHCEVCNCSSTQTCWQSTHPLFYTMNWMSRWKRASVYVIVKGKNSVRASFTLSCVIALFSHFLIQWTGGHVAVHLKSELSFSKSFLKLANHFSSEVRWVFSVLGCVFFLKAAQFRISI